MHYRLDDYRERATAVLFHADGHFMATLRSASGFYCETPEYDNEMQTIHAVRVLALALHLDVDLVLKEESDGRHD